MAKHRVKEEKLLRVRLGSRYTCIGLRQFYWECLKIASASEGLTETDILRRIIRSWSETLPPAIQEQARADTARVEAWKAEELRARQDAKLQAKLNARRPNYRKRGSRTLVSLARPGWSPADKETMSIEVSRVAR